MVEQEELKVINPMLGTLCCVSSPLWNSQPYPDMEDLVAVTMTARSTLTWASWTFLTKEWQGEMKWIEYHQEALKKNTQFVTAFRKSIKLILAFCSPQNASQTFKRV